MKNLLIISFDLNREGECQSFAVGSLISTLKNNKFYGEKYEISWHPINLLTIDNFDINYLQDSELFKLELSQYTHIAISCYVWSKDVVNPLIDKIFEKGFQGKIILGGYEITYSNNQELKKCYPRADYFISGHAEETLLKLLTNYISLDNSLLSSPYLSNVLPLSQNIKKIRWETKRGCPYKCNFCAHRDLSGKKVFHLSLDKAYKELALFKEYNVGKINVIDPVFNIGNDYLKIIDEAKRIGLESELSFQIRPELVTEEFLNRIKNLNVCLEFGVQTLNEQENKFIKRRNNYSKIFDTIKKVNERNVRYEISLIYGLPFQTVSTFSNSINTLKDFGCTSITAFPLLLLKGTELYNFKNEFKFREIPFGKYNIPTVIESNTFTEDEWWQMHKMAENLKPNNRV